MTGSIAYRNLASARITALAGIVALHVLVAYLLLTALVQRPVTEAHSLTVVAVQSDPTPPVPTPHMQTGATSDTHTPLPPPPIPDFTPPVSPEAPTPNEMVVSPLPPDGSAQPPPIRVLGKHWLPSSEAYYPADLIRNGVRGDSLVRVCVDEGGRMAGAPALERSSGNARLDQGALNVARAGRYARAMRGDTPVPNCYLFHIVFTFAPSR